MAALPYIAAFVLGISVGLRVFTAPAVFYLIRGSKIGHVLGIIALAEMVGDALPTVPARTFPPLLLARLFGGAFIGWVSSNAHGLALVGALVGVVGSWIGSYGGLKVRTIMIKAVGALPAAILEDLVAILLAIFAVAQL